MRVYIDIGVFIDYLTARGLAGTPLRTAGRRGRTLDQVVGDAERVLERASRRHQGATSALTYYEAEEALYKSLAGGTAGVAHADPYRVAAARSILPQIAIAVRYFNLEVLALTAETVDTLLRTLELQTHGIRAADALHIATASRWNADVILTADEAILRLDDVLSNEMGKPIRCYDTDDALSVL